MIPDLTTDELRAWIQQCDTQATAHQQTGSNGLAETWQRRREFLQAVLEHRDALRANIEFNNFHAPWMRAFKGQEVG